MTELLIGVDIGGTKCAVVLGNRVPEILERIEFPTRTEMGPEQAVIKIEDAVEKFIDKSDKGAVKYIGISCGGPLNSRTGVILSPPNLPGWDNIAIVERLSNKFGIPAAVENDANACALAEWKWGAGKGLRNVVFLTFGTGIGAGLILDGKLYSGTNDMAGEAGHIRLENDGPLGYGKRGSFEGFCSGGGLAQQAEDFFKIKDNNYSDFCREFSQGRKVTARDICKYAAKGDPAALEILKNSGKHLGMGLSVLIDLLNPELIIIGSIYVRCRAYLEPAAEAVIREEALENAQKVCSVVPAVLGEAIGDYGCLGVALNGLERG